MTCDSYGDHHLHMCQRSQHTDTQTRTQAHKNTKLLLTHTIIWCVNVFVVTLLTHVHECNVSMYIQYLHVMSHRRTHTYIQACRKHKLLHTYHTMVCVSGCLIVYVSVCGDFIDTCACNDSRSLRVDVSHHASQC